MVFVFIGFYIRLERVVSGFLFALLLGTVNYHYQYKDDKENYREESADIGRQGMFAALESVEESRESLE